MKRKPNRAHNLAGKAVAAAAAIALAIGLVPHAPALADDAVPDMALSPQSTTVIPIGSDGKPTVASGTGWTFDGSTLTLYLGSFSVSNPCSVPVIDNGGAIDGGVFNGSVTIKYYTSEGTTYYGQINDGTFNGSVSTSIACEIHGGTFYSTVACSGDMTGGTFYGLLSGSCRPHSGNFGVTNSLTRLTTNNDPGTFPVGSYSEILSATGYALPQTITVTMNGVVATAGTDYTWNSSTGKLDIPLSRALEKSGPIAITAAATTPIAYTVVFDKNADDATNTMTNESMTYDQEKALTANAFARAGYTFAGWATTQIGAVAYTDGASVENLTTLPDSTVTLYAQWVPIPTVTGLNLTYTGSPQALATVSDADGTMHWRLGKTGAWSTAIPQGTYAGSYDVYWYMDMPSLKPNSAMVPEAVATGNGSADAPNLVTATIAPAPTSITLGSAALSTTYPSSASTSVTLSKGVLESSVKAVSSDPSKLTAAISGGVLTVTPVQGATDVAGDYTVTVSGDSADSNYTAPASVVLKVTVANAAAADSSSSAKTTPSTGDSALPTAAAALALACGSAAVLALARRRSARSE